MRLLPGLGVAFALAGLLSGCLTTQEVLTKVEDLAGSLFNNLSIGAYKATPQQIRLADQRADAAYKKFSTSQKQALKESGTRYLAVRTSDPTPAQNVEIRSNLKKPGKYSSLPKSASTAKIYCVMIWDTQSREVVGTDCYAVLSLPKSGTLAHFDTYTAQYVGNF
jgi:hypothetical protein